MIIIFTVFLFMKIPSLNVVNRFNYNLERRIKHYTNNNNNTLTLKNFATP